MLKRFDIIERIGPNDLSCWTVDLDEKLFEPFTNEGSSTAGTLDDLIREISNDDYFMRPINDDEKLQMFHEQYEDQWDYLHNVLECGLMLGFFIHDEAPDYKWMYTGPQPTHISEVPEPIRMRYISYLKLELAKQRGIKRCELVYTELEAADDFCETL